MSICICEGRYKGCLHGPTCSKLAGGQWSPHFCLECDERRMAHLDAVFDEIDRKNAAHRRRFSD